MVSGSRACLTLNLSDHPHRPSRHFDAALQWTPSNQRCLSRTTLGFPAVPRLRIWRSGVRIPRGAQQNPSSTALCRAADWCLGCWTATTCDHVGGHSQRDCDHLRPLDLDLERNRPRLVALPDARQGESDRLIVVLPPPAHRSVDQLGAGVRSRANGRQPPCSSANGATRRPVWSAPSTLGTNRYGPRSAGQSPRRSARRAWPALGRGCRRGCARSPGRGGPAPQARAAPLGAPRARWTSPGT
jgi:hypothetical protein